MLATICGGGTGTTPTSLVGSTPLAANQYRIHKSCVPPGKVTATLTSVFPPDLALAIAPFNPSPLSWTLESL